MRILIINSEFPPIGGGAGNASAYLGRELVKLGQDVTVLTVHYGDLPRETCQDGVQIFRMKAKRRRFDRSSAVEQIIFLLLGSLRIRSFVRKYSPDVIVAFFGVPSGAIAMTAKMLTNIPYLISLRGGDVPGFRPYDFALYHRLVAPLLRLVWRQSAALVANSMGLQTLAQKFDAQSPIGMIPNGVDVRYYAPKARSWDPPQMLLVGRLVYQKGIDILLQALKELKNIPWSLSLVGDGPERERIQAMADDFGLSNRVAFKRWLSGDALLAQYHRANLFVFPSRHEGMPNAVLEAMACGLPVVASRIAGNEELVVDGKTGVLVPSENPRALRRALQTTLTDPASRKRMGAAARQRVEQHYTWKRVARQYLTVLQQITGMK